MNDELAYSTATVLTKKLREGEVSSREMLETYLRRVDSINPRINAVVARDAESARARADDADAARKRGESWGPLHGLPMTVKDTFEVVGMPCVAGAVQYRNHRPTRNAVAVQRLLDAGAIVFGKTNVPELGGDLQSYNKVYGSTNNPWDLSRTPGGSSGGAAAALAAGMTSVELGSDIGGSIRTPAHYCGVFGHKPTHGIVPMRGHIPGPPGMVTEADLVVAGPMARSAEDLELLLGVTAGPSMAHALGWSLSLPSPRLESLGCARVLAWFDDELCPIDSEMRVGYQELIAQLRKQGALVTEGSPKGLSLERFYVTYLNLLGSVMASALHPGLRALMKLSSHAYNRVQRAAKLPPHMGHYLRGGGQSHGDWLRQNEGRNRLKEEVTSTFDDYDVILAPVVPTMAIAHQQKPELPFRTITVNGVEQPYTDHLKWVSFATLLGLPATSAPVGQSRDGLPYNVQIIGPPFGDRTTIRFADLLSVLTGGFRPPPLSPRS